MKHSSELLVEASPADVHAVLRDLATYPAWNDLVDEALVDSDTSGDDAPAWRTTLRAQVGPFARAKQLRFVRVRDISDADRFQTRFERHELDGRDHANWIMETEVQSGGTDEQSMVRLDLTYEGGLWVPTLSSVLGSAIERSVTRLSHYVAGRG